MESNIFKNRKLVIATMHGKEQIIAPILEKELGVTCLVASGINTDSLGTFTGEIERKLDPISAAREKCLLALKQSDCDLAVASEGSFGAHPEIFFASANEELVLLLDLKNNLQIVGRVLSTSTNFDGKEIDSWKELQDFAESVLFPSHALIMRSSEKSTEGIAKGIKDWKTLESCYESFHAKYGFIWVETDMRAMHNPNRMKVIEEATLQLVHNIKSCCPSCSSPGFVVQNSNKGLPCEICHQPTRTVRSLVYTCQSCSYEEVRKRPDGKTFEDAMYCDFCNP